MITTELSSRRPVPVEIGSFTLFCEEFRASGSRTFTEVSDVSGSAACTGSFPRASRLTFSGRICSDYSPVYFVKQAGNMLRAGTKFDIEYRGLTFKDCVVQAFSANDKGDDFITAELTVLTDRPVMISNDEEV